MMRWHLRAPVIAMVAGLVLLAGCSSPQKVATESDAAEAADPARFIDQLSAHCGRAFSGRVVVDQPPTPEAIWQEPMVLHLRCQGPGRLLGLSLGEDRSRVWLLASTSAGLRLMHSHHNPDGTADEVSGYGGVADRGTSTTARVEFPADQAAKDLFRAHGMVEAVDSIWTLEVADDGQSLIYAWRRPDRHFRIAFDLTQPVAVPPLPWAEAPLF